MIKPFLDDNFLLNNSVAEYLYHEHAKEQAIIDYHNHLPPNEIANEKQFLNLTEVWLQGDHYKWRAMRANGVDENYITGDASDQEKFFQWASTVPYTARNPLYHWTHLELKRYFGITELLTEKTASEIYSEANRALAQREYKAIGLLKQMNVEMVCTTDHPTDDLTNHLEFARSEHGFKMLPTFRPDKFLSIGHEDFLVFLQDLEAIVGNVINSFDHLLASLESRMDYFESAGCKLSDHGLNQLFDISEMSYSLDQIISKRKENKKLTQEEQAYFQMSLLNQLAISYYKRNWTMQLHLGAIRNNNQRLSKSIGADVGCDSIGDYEQARGLAYFLNQLDQAGQLTKTILYNLNPRDNEVFASMAGNFNEGEIPGKIQLGSAWWFLDQKRGIENQLNVLSDFGLLSRFIGMLTDSRSFLSFPRHEYFRRILCNLIGEDVSNGELPNDSAWLGQMVEDICYGNAKRFFNF